MVPDEIVALARKVRSNVEAKDISLLQGGFSSQAYKVTGSNQNFVLVVERPGSVSHSDYGRAYVALLLLQKHNYKFAPKPLWLKDDQQAMAMTYVEGAPADKCDFSKIDTEQLAINIIDALLSTATITQDQYAEVAKQFNISEIPVVTRKIGVQRYGVEWFEIVKKSCPDQTITDWLQRRIQAAIDLTEELEDDQPTFGHGDPSNPNIIIKPNGDFTFVDWGSARFHANNPEFFIAYTTRLTDFMSPYREVLVKHVAARLNVSEEVLASRVIKFRKFTEVFDVNWAAMMMAKIQAGEAEGDLEKFRAIANERIKLYEQDFGVDD